MDLLEDLPPPPAFFPPPAPAANAPPSAPAAMSLSGPKIFVLPPFRATSTTSIGTSTPRRRMSRWGITRLFLSLPLVTPTPSPSIIVPISRPFKLLIRRRLFTLSLNSRLPSLNRDVSFSFLPLPPLLLPTTGRHLLPSRRLQFSLILMLGLPLEALPGDMTPPQLRLRPGRLLSLFLSPPAVPILTGSMAPLLSSKWGVLGEWKV